MIESMRELTVVESELVGGGGVPMGPPIYVTVPFPNSGMPVNGGGGSGQHHQPLQH